MENKPPVLIQVKYALGIFFGRGLTILSYPFKECKKYFQCRFLTVISILKVN
jgi:hypothetical protein